MAVLLALAGAVTVVASRPAPALAEVHLQVADGRLAITLLDLEAPPRRLEAVLRGLGVRTEIVEVPVGPSEVGRVVGTSDADGLAPELERLDAGEATFRGFSVPVGWTGPLALHVGRPAASGEWYAQLSDALAPGEPLACRPLLGATARAVRGALADAPLDVAFQPDGVPPVPPLAAPALAASGYDDWVVGSAAAASTTRVVVRLVPPSPVPDAPTTAPGCRR